MTSPALMHDLLALLTDDPTRADALLRDYLPNGALKVLTPDPIKLRDAAPIPEDVQGELFGWVFEARMTTGEIMLIPLVADTATEEDPEMPLTMMLIMIRVQRRYLATERKTAGTTSPKLPKLFPIHLVTNRKNAKPVPFFFEQMGWRGKLRILISLIMAKFRGTMPPDAIAPGTLNIFVPDR